MKRFISVLAAAILLLSAVSALAETWTCPACGAEVSGNFCSNCGTPRPEEDAAWYCPACGTRNEGNFCSGCGAKKETAREVIRSEENLIRLDLDIGFEKNAYSSTYDVKMFIDDEYVATLNHGDPYQGTVEVAPGTHTAVFQKDGNNRVDGSVLFDVNEPTRFSCVIHAKWDEITITGDRTTVISADDPLPGETSVIYVNGTLNLSVSVEFERNIAFSKYDVDMYLDDVYVATLPHGNDFEGTLGVSPGEHVLKFCKARAKAISGTSKFTVSADAVYSCRIEATAARVKVTKERIR